MTTGPVDNLGEEREIELRSLGSRLLSGWWVVLGGLALGILAGILVAASGGAVYEAKSLLYMGQPFIGGQQVTTFATNPRTVTALIRSEAVLEQVANQTGVPVANLRGAVAAQAVTAAGASAGIGRAAPLMELSVRLKRRESAEKAANAFADIIVADIGGFVEEKLRLLRVRIEENAKGLVTARERITAALEQRRRSLESDLPLDVRLLLQANANGSLQFWEVRASNREANLRETQSVLNTTLSVERSQVVQPAVAARTSARSRRNSAVVGGLIGLILGGVAASALPASLMRRKRSAET